MHMTKTGSNNETPIHNSFWSYCLAIITTIVLADVLTGGLVRQSLTGHAIEYGVLGSFMLATVGVYAKDGPPGLKFVRACSRHKL